MKKIAFFLLLVFGVLSSTMQANSSTQKPIAPTGLNKFFNYLGDKTDQWLTGGDISPEQQIAFEEITRAMGMEDWGIQIKKSGALQKKLGGDYNAMAYPFTNRVYFGEKLLEGIFRLTDEELRFVMAHELAHYRNHHGWKRILLFLPSYYLCRSLIKNLITLKDCNDTQSSITSYDWKKAGITALGAYASFLLFLYASRKFETEADTDAVTVAGIKPEAGIAFFELFKTPHENSKGASLLHTLRTFFSDLHSQHPPDHERIEHLKTLKKTQNNSIKAKQ